MAVSRVRVTPQPRILTELPESSPAKCGGTVYWWDCSPSFPTQREWLTAGEVRRVVGVGQEQVVGLGHPEVHHLGCVLQSPHRILVHHILKTHVVHLVDGDRRNRIGITNRTLTRLITFVVLKPRDYDQTSPTTQIQTDVLNL